MDASRTVKAAMKHFVKITAALLIFGIAILFIIFSGVLLGQQEERNEHGNEVIIVENPEEDEADASDSSVLMDQEGLKLKEVMPLSPVGR